MTQTAEPVTNQGRDGGRAGFVRKTIRALFPIFFGLGLSHLLACTSHVSVATIVTHPSEFDGRHVVVDGVVCDLTTSSSQRLGTPYSIFRLCEGDECMRVFAWEIVPKIDQGRAATVRGTFELITYEDPQIYLNEFHPDEGGVEPMKGELARIQERRSGVCQV